MPVVENGSGRFLIKLEKPRPPNTFQTLEESTIVLPDRLSAPPWLYFVINDMEFILSLGSRLHKTL